MTTKLLLITLCTLFFTTPLISEASEDIVFNDQQPCEACLEKEKPLIISQGNILAIGPEFYHVRRSREGGTRQNGTLYGVRATYDYIKRYKIYLGALAFYGSGILKGHTGSDDKIRSRLTDTQYEGNLGYTLQYKYCPFYSLTPFAGYGYFQEENKFMSPSPLHIKFKTHFQYFSFGFLSSAMISQNLMVGLNARFKYMWDAKCKTTDDPDFEGLTQNIENRIHYRIELPITYCQPFFCHWYLAAIPFFEMRQYGGRENFPFDFFETKFRIYGLNLQISYRF